MQTQSNPRRRDRPPGADVRLRARRHRSASLAQPPRGRRHGCHRVAREKRDCLAAGTVCLPLGSGQYRLYGDALRCVAPSDGMEAQCLARLVGCSGTREMMRESVELTVRCRSSDVAWCSVRARLACRWFAVAVQCRRLEDGSLSRCWKPDAWIGARSCRAFLPLCALVPVGACTSVAGFKKRSRWRFVSGLRCCWSLGAPSTAAQPPSAAALFPVQCACAFAHLVCAWVRIVASPTVWSLLRCLPAWPAAADVFQVEKVPSWPRAFHRRQPAALRRLASDPWRLAFPLRQGSVAQQGRLSSPSR